MSVSTSWGIPMESGNKLGAVLKCTAILLFIMLAACGPPIEEPLQPEDFPYVACNCATACLNDEGVMIVNSLIASYHARDHVY